MLFQKGNLFGKISKGMSGKKQSEETRRKMSEAHKGKKHSEEWNKRISLSKLGYNNPQWKGDEVSYGQLHQWVRRHKEKQLCPCGKSPHDVANISGKYLRDINDYIWLCRKCHMKSDGRLDNFMKNRFLKKGDKKNVSTANTKRNAQSRLF